jgi:hypothetical protein
VFWLSNCSLFCSSVTLAIRVGGIVAVMLTLLWPTQCTMAGTMFVSCMKTR